ncbi:MAG TPA: type II toxin-antitoxin system VapC family toxin [Anaerolineales bacterium]|nr:type II toxin-antitoxin system VapC family toxin [Anaerolineales bacterium]
MNVVDSSGWLEYFGEGKNSQYFAPVIRKTNELIVPTISMYEVYKKIVQQRDEEEALSAIGWMSTCYTIDLNQELALTAAVLSMEHKIPMADSIILATARANDATLWTQDEHFKDLEGVRYIKKT